MTGIGGYCTNCGTGWQAGQNYCGSCAAAVGTAAAAGLPGAASGSPAAGSGSVGASGGAVASGPSGARFGGREGAEPGPGDGAPYPREAVIGAVLLAIFMPFIALIAALVLRAQEMRPARREQLKSWAVASGAWLATGWVIGIIVFASAVSAISPSGCKGGIDLAVPPAMRAATDSTGSARSRA
jgi:hypothetical protein